MPEHDFNRLLADAVREPRRDDMQGAEPGNGTS
jgi:hypothetical protein